MKETDRSALLNALTQLREDGFRTGRAWEAAHALAQEHEGEAMFDRLHGLCHRIEGDAGNAAYWYRRAGETPFDGSFSAEAEAIGKATGG